FHPLAGIDVAEQQVAAFLPPQRPFGRTKRTSESARDLADRLGGGNDLVQRGIEPVDARGEHHFGRKRRTLLRQGCAETACGSAARGGREGQQVPARDVGLSFHEIYPPRQGFVGWVEPSRTHQRMCRAAMPMMGFASLNPSYGATITPSLRPAPECRR